MQASKKAKKSPPLGNEAAEPKSTPGSQPPTSAATASIPVRKRKAQETAPEQLMGSSESVPVEMKKAKGVPLHKHKASVASDAPALADALQAARHPASAAAMHSRNRKQKAKLNQAPVPSKRSDRDRTAARNTADATPALQQGARQPIPDAAATAPRQNRSRHAKSSREPASKGSTQDKHASNGAADASASKLFLMQSTDGGRTAKGYVERTASEDSDAENVSDDGDLSADTEAGAAHNTGGAADGKASAGAERPKLTEEQRQERLQRTMFVGNLPAAVKAKRLKQAFARCASLSPTSAAALRSLPPCALIRGTYGCHAGQSACPPAPEGATHYTAERPMCTMDHWYI